MRHRHLKDQEVSHFHITPSDIRNIPLAISSAEIAATALAFRKRAKISLSAGSTRLMAVSPFLSLMLPKKKKVKCVCN
jgi:hypothetical protein